MTGFYIPNAPLHCSHLLPKRGDNHSRLLTVAVIPDGSEDFTRSRAELRGVRNTCRGDRGTKDSGTGRRPSQRFATQQENKCALHRGRCSPECTQSRLNSALDERLVVTDRDDLCAPLEPLCGILH